jgi:hypothetical protein
MLKNGELRSDHQHAQRQDRARGRNQDPQHRQQQPRSRDDHASRRARAVVEGIRALKGRRLQREAAAGVAPKVKRR